MLERAAACGRDALLRTVAVTPEITQSTGLVLLQRLQSHLFASTSSQLNSTQQQAHRQATTRCHCSDSESWNSQLTSSVSSKSNSSVQLPEQQLAGQQQRQQHWPQQQLLQLSSSRSNSRSSTGSLFSSLWSLSSSRGYAGNADRGFGRRRRMPGSRGRQSDRQHGQQSSFTPPDVDRQLLGRKAGLCVPTETLYTPDWERYWPEHPKYNPFRDDRAALRDPVQPGGGTGDDLDAHLLLRQQVENSALPSELKRSALITGPGWDELLLQVKRTIKVTKGGKVETLHALVAVGNANGVIGIGEHSGKNIQKVVMDAQFKAYRNLVAIPRYRQHTVYHPIDLKNRTVRMQIWPRITGFGITASPLITQLCELAGIQNVTIKVTGRRRNVHNVVHTFMEALLGQSLPHDGVEGSGVYMREVWHRRELPCGLKRGVHVP